ncbi:hypothetical protein SFRURICE_006763, partial [Spodoptera frugiperda]
MKSHPKHKCERLPSSIILECFAYKRSKCVGSRPSDAHHNSRLPSTKFHIQRKHFHQVRDGAVTSPVTSPVHNKGADIDALCVAPRHIRRRSFFLELYKQLKSHPLVNVSDRDHAMPIITPAYPQQNLTFNVSASTRSVMVEEFKIANATSQPPANCCSMWFIGLQLQQTSRSLDLSHDIQTFTENINNVGGRTNMLQKGMTIQPYLIRLELEKTSRSLDLSHDIQTFTENINNAGGRTNMLREGMAIQSEVEGPFKNYGYFNIFFPFFDIKGCMRRRNKKKTTNSATPIAKEKTNELKKYLTLYDAPESREQVEHRWTVFNDLQELVRTWIREESMNQGMPEIEANSVGGNVFQFGSYNLGVNMDDIDALCFAPRNIQRADFFTSFYNILNDHPKVTDLRIDGSSFVTQIKMKFCDIVINISFANLKIAKVPAWLDLDDDIVVKDLDLDCVRSLNMYRLTDELLQLVPDVNNFRLTLRVIILWAKRRRIYSKALGYLHDVSLAILVAHTCQQYPNALPAILVHKFFLTLNQWMWPLPIQLKNQQTLESDFSIWLPVNAADLYHPMPIITPVYPEDNANSNMCMANTSVVMEEIRIGLATTDDIMSYQCGWDKLFEDTKFFSRYEHYVVVLASSTTPDDELEWSELVESKISVLVGQYNTIYLLNHWYHDLQDSLDRHHQIVITHLNPESYSSVCSLPLNNNEQSPTNKYSMWFVGLVFEKTAQQVDIKYETDKFTSAVLSQVPNTNLIRGEGKTIAIRFSGPEELHHYLPGSLLPRRRASCKPSARSAARATLRRAKRPSETSVTAL